MDPNKALEEIRSMCREVFPDPEDGYTVDLEKAAEMIETFEGLDAWLTRGGFKPKDWDHSVNL